MGLPQPGIAFRLGPSSTKQPKAQGIKKNKGGHERKNKENRKVSGTEKKSDREEDINNVGSNMENEMMEMGIKRRARTQLAELEKKEDNGKRV